MQPSCDDLLVVLHRVEHLFQRDVADRRQRTEARHQVGERLAVRLLHGAARHGQFGRDEHAVADRFAVSEPTVLGNRLERVSGGVAEVEDAAQARFLLVLRDHVRLDPARLGDDRGQHLGFTIEDRAMLLRDTFEERGAGGDAVLDDFIEAGAELAARQRAEHRRVGDHRVRLVEGADQVLPERMVDADLAANRAVDLRQERGRYVDERDAAQVGGGGVAREVADDAAAERDEGGRALGVRLDEGVVNLHDRRHLLVAFAVGHDDRFGLRGLREALPVESPDGRAGDDEPSSRRLHVVEQLCEVSEHAVTEGDDVRARGSGDVDADWFHVGWHPKSLG